MDTFTPTQNLVDKARAAAKLGAEWLDRRKSDWYKNLRKISVKSGFYCPLGQVFNHYDIGCKYMWDINDRKKHGFTYNHLDEIELLDAAWEEEIVKRLTKDKVKPMATSSPQDKVMNLFVALPPEVQKDFKNKLRAQIMAAGEAIDELVCNPLVEDSDTEELKKMIGFLSNMADEVEAL